jgi:hypothetical protein
MSNWGVVEAVEVRRSIAVAEPLETDAEYGAPRAVERPAARLRSVESADCLQEQT